MPDEPRIPIVDAHLDMAWNVLKGRDLRLEAAEVRAAEMADEHECMVTLPELRRGGVAIAFGSIFVRPQHTGRDVDPVFDPDTAAEGRRQAEVYRRWEDQGLVRIIRDRRSLDSHLTAWTEDSIPGIVVAIEGAEPIRDADEPEWFELGVRSIGTAWGFSRFSGGYSGSWGRPGGFTPLGRELLAGMNEVGILLDLAHSSVETWHEGVELAAGRVACTHTSPREVLGVERMPDAAMRAELAQAGGVVGLGLGGVFLHRGWWADQAGGRPPLGLNRVGEVFTELAQGAGWEHVGIGSDLDGGIGVQESPDELESIADIGRIAEVLPAESSADVMGENWISLLRRVLPATVPAPV